MGRRRSVILAATIQTKNASPEPNHAAPNTPPSSSAPNPERPPKARPTPIARLAQASTRFNFPLDTAAAPIASRNAANGAAVLARKNVHPPSR